MATRSLTEAFILMRNNALQNRHLFSEQLNDDLTALVGRDEIDIELGNASYKNSHLPPQWTDRFEEIQFDITRLKKKIKDLATLHNQHLNRPTLDDNADEEQAINVQTQEITNMFHRCQRLVQDFNVSGRLASGKEQMLGQNMASSVARCLQDLSSSFRISQSTYLRKLKNREERSNQYFLEDVDTTEGSESNHLDDLRFSASQQHVVEDNTVFVQQREKEVLQIVRSIQDLNEIFKELSSMIVDQGTILDRIDYNVEQASTHVEKGLEQLQKAEKYQKSRKTVEKLTHIRMYSTTKDGKWDISRSLRYNQDAQREEEQRRMRDIIKYLTRLPPNHEKLDRLKQREKQTTSKSATND